MVAPGGKDVVALDLTLSDRGFRTGLDGASRRARTFGRDLEGSFTRANTAAGRLSRRITHIRREMGRGIMARGGGLVRAGLGMAGVFGFHQAIVGAKNFDAVLTDMMITGNKSAQWLGTVRQKVLDVSNATGRGKTEVAGYMQAIITQTGDADAALNTLEQMGDVALATGANMEALGGIAVKLGGAMRVQSKDTYAAMNILRAQEKLGSVTMANISQYFGQIASLAPGFGRAGEGLGGVRALGGLFQIGARGYSIDQPGMAATGTARFLERLSRSPEKIEKALQIKIRDKQGQFLALPEIFRRIGEAGAKDRAKFAKQGTTLFGIQGYKVAQQLQAAAIAGWGKKQGIYGSAASLFTAGGEDVIAQDAAKRRASVSFKFDQAMAKLSNTLSKHMLPVLKELVKVIPTFALGLKLALEHSRQIIMVWAGFKVAKILHASRLAMQAAGAGAGPGAAGMLGPAAMRGAGGAGARYDLYRRYSPSFIGPVRGPMAPPPGPAPSRMAMMGAWYDRKFGASTHLGRHAGKYGLAGAIAGSFMPQGAFGGGKMETGMDMAAGIAMMAGGPVGLAAGAGYYAAKGIFHIVNAELNTEKIDTKGYKEYADRGFSFRMLQERAKNVGYMTQTSGQREAIETAYEAAVGTGNIDAIRRTQLALQKRRQIRLQKLTGGKAGAMEAFGKLSGAQKTAIAPGIAMLDVVINRLGEQIKARELSGKDESITRQNYERLGQIVGAAVSSAIEKAGTPGTGEPVPGGGIAPPPASRLRRGLGAGRTGKG